jgi:hypothetical protein
MVCYCGFYANANRGKVRKAGLSHFALRIAEEQWKRPPSKGWASMSRKVGSFFFLTSIIHRQYILRAKGGMIS